MTYQLPEPPELKFTLQYNEALITEYGQACYQAGRDSMKPWVGLTDEERDAITSKVIGFNNCCGWEDDYAIAIEAKLKEKNS